MEDQSNTQHSADSSSTMAVEDILNEVSNRFVLFPIRYKAIWNMYKKAESAFWTAEEIDLSKDLDDWEKLSDNERFFIKNILAFFAGSDGIVNENLAVRFMNEVKPAEAKAFYGFQIAMENIHCVKGDTMILTRDGYMPIASLEGTYVDVWNGGEFSEVKVVKTSLKAPMMHIVLNNGMHLTCTPEHKWILADGTRVLAMDLVKNQPLMVYFNYPVIDCRDPDEFWNPHFHGFMCLDKNSEVQVDSALNKPKYTVPINYSVITKTRWLQGLLKHAYQDTQGTIVIQCPHNIFLRDLQLLLTTLNVRSSIFLSDDTVSSKLWITHAEHEKLLSLGCGYEGTSNLTVPDEKQPSEPLLVQSVVQTGAELPSYCFSEPLRQSGIFNGILTGQSETYSLLIDTYIKDAIEKNRLLNAIDTIPCIQRKAQWALKWIDDQTTNFATRVVAFACVEGIFFSGAFCAIFWLKERGLMPGLCFSNELISRDESLHTEFAVLLHSMLREKIDAEAVYSLVSEAVDIENEFITQSIPCSLLGMNADLMSQYIKFVADRLLVQLGFNKKYHVNNPFNFMDRICLDTKTNFFENREGNYAKANVGNIDNSARFTFSKNEDF